MNNKNIINSTYKLSAILSVLNLLTAQELAYTSCHIQLFFCELEKIAQQLQFFTGHRILGTETKNSSKNA